MTAARRVEALRLAIALHQPVQQRHQPDDHDLRRLLWTAERLEAWLDRPYPAAHLTFSFGPVLDQDAGQPTGTILEGDTVQIHDDEQFSLNVEAKDAKGYVVADELSWTAATLDGSDASAIVTLEVSDDTQTCVVKAGVPGSCVITVSDDEGLSATEAVDVVPGDVATISIAEGEVTKQQ